MLTLATSAALSSLSCSPATITSNGGSSCTLTLANPAPAGGMIVSLSDDNPVLATPASVTVAAGSTVASFMVTAGNIGSDQSATVTAVAGGSSKATVVTLAASVALSSLACSPSTIAPNGSSTCVVSLTKAAPNGANVILSEDNSVLTTPPSAIVPAGYAAATFTVTAGNALSNQTVNVVAIFSGSSKAATLTVTASAPATPAVPASGGTPATSAGGPVTTQQAETIMVPRASVGPTRLLFPFVNTQTAFDTQITITNTSLDTAGSVPQAGTCDFRFYGTGAPSTGVSDQIAAGRQLVFLLSQGANGIPAAPNFQGYVVANCGFPLARGTAKIVGSGKDAYSTDAQILTLPRSTASPQYLLFPFLTNQGGLDSTISIANTSADPFGTPQSSGFCALSFYGANAPAAGLTVAITPGTAYTTPVSTIAPGFSGYAIASCAFAGAVGTGFVSDPGALSMSFAETAEPLSVPRDTTPRPLLFPAVTNQNGMDTQIAIANTGSDPFGSGTVSGACTLNFYGANAPSPVSTANIAPGSVYTNTLSALAPGFQGYVLAVCPFALSRGWAYTNPAGTTSDGDSQAAEIIMTPRSATPRPLLFTAASNSDGADTNITISNTSQDPLGTSQAPGTCTVSYFGDMVGGGSPPSPATSASIPVGGQLSFWLSRGNPAQSIPAAAGFHGYLIADCTFPSARGVAMTAVSGAGALTASQTALLTTFSTHAGYFVQGQTNATYTIAVTNDGKSPTAGTITVTETIPAGMTLVGMAGSGWTCPSGGSTCSRTDALNPGASYPPITVKVNVAPTASSSLINQVTVSGGNSAAAAAIDSTVIMTPGRGRPNRGNGGTGRPPRPQGAPAGSRLPEN
jgi:uncharacterized repeat protein (TIGR01451 family)